MVELNTTWVCNAKDIVENQVEWRRSLGRGKVRRGPEHVNWYFFVLNTHIYSMACLIFSPPKKEVKKTSWILWSLWRIVEQIVDSKKGPLEKNPSTCALKSKIGVDKKSNTLWHFLESKAPQSSYKCQNNKINPRKDFHNLENLNHEIQNASQQASIWKSKTKSEISWEQMFINLLRKTF